MPKPLDAASLLADLDEIEALLRLPNVKEHADKAKRLALSMARRGSGAIPDQAMRLLSAIEDLERGNASATARIQATISNLRAAVKARP